VAHSFPLVVRCGRTPPREAAARRVRRYRRPRRISRGATDVARSEKFFILFSKAGSNVVESAAILTEFVAVPSERWAKLAKRMRDAEHAGDDTTSVVDPEQGGCQDEGAAVDGGVPVVSGREPAPMFEAVEGSLDDVALVGDWPSAA
jgi:hypothetical protein